MCAFACFLLLLSWSPQLALPRDAVNKRPSALYYLLATRLSSGQNLSLEGFHLGTWHSYCLLSFLTQVLSRSSRPIWGGLFPPLWFGRELFLMESTWYFRKSLLKESQWEEEKSHLSQICPQLLRSAVWIQCLVSLLCSSLVPKPTGRSRMHSLPSLEKRGFQGDVNECLLTPPAEQRHISTQVHLGDPGSLLDLLTRMWVTP